MSEQVAIIDYGSGNLHSAQKALERAAREADLSRDIFLTDDPKAVMSADRVVLPGVGAFADCRNGLAAIPGMIEALDEVATRAARPLLGICVGMQLMATTGREHGDHPGFGWIPGEVAALKPAGDGVYKLPHMGWNRLDILAPDHPVLSDLADGEAHAYFVHSYAFRTDEPGHCLARADYGGPFTAIVGRGTIVGTQFHPEKSQAVGLKLLENFLAWRP